MSFFRRFWMVWGDGGTGPTHRHQTEELAKQEAERLANLSPRQKFYVLEATSSVVKDSVQWSDPIDDDDVPF